MMQYFFYQKEFECNESWIFIHINDMEKSIARVKLAPQTLLLASYAVLCEMNHSSTDQAREIMLALK